MIPNLVMLADLDPENPTAGMVPITDSRYYPMLIMLGALILAAVLASVWAVRYSLRKKRRKHRHHHHSHASVAPADAARQPEPGAETRARKKRRKPRRPHRPLNPTLAQTGGLPPLRDKDAPLPPMP